LTHRAVAGAGVKSNDTTENGFAPNGTISRIDFPYPGWEDSPFGWSGTGRAMQSRHIWNVKGGLRSLFKLYGAKNIRFEGLTFRDSAGSGIEIQLCENITVLKCKIYNIKKHAINAPGGKNVTIDSCDIHDIGLMAIINTGGNKQTLEPANKLVTRCSIKRFGRLVDTSAAIRIEGVGNTVSYNLISDGPSGVHASLGNDIIIEYNHFHKLCKNNDDAGAVYAGRNASSFNIVVRNNFFNDIGPDQDGGFIYGSFNGGCAGGSPPNTRSVTDNDKRVQGVIGVYFDDLLSGNTISQNVFYKCGRGDWGGGIGFNGGINHKIENNIFVECPSGYGDIINAKKVWNASLSGQAFYVINTEAYPWYESGGPLDRDGITTIPVTGYSPWTMPFGPTAYPSEDFRGVMAVSDIRADEYKNRAPWLHEIYNFSNSNPGTPGTITVNVDKAVLYKTQATNNVFVNCTKISHSGVVGSDPLDPSVIGGFIVNGQFESTDMTHFVNVPAFDFRLTEEGLRQIKLGIPGFSNIPFQSIPTINYVPESYTQQTWQTCAVGNGHYSCEREFSDPDALEAIVTDPRFNTTINTVNGKTFYTDFMDRYNLCKTEIDTRQRSLFSIYSNDWYVATATTAAQALSPMYGYLGDTQNPQNNMQVFPWGNSNAQAATRAWTDTVVDWGDAFYRPTMWTQALSSTGYNNVSLTQDYSYPLNNEEFKYFDNGYGWKGSPKIAKSDTNVSPPFYGELTPNALGTFSYIINPTTDDERYLFSSIDPNSTPPATTLRYSSPTWLAFLLDMRLMKAIHRSDDTAWQRFAPWIVSTDVGGEVDRYRYGPLTGDVGKQYWKEIILHSCLHGAKFINYFNGVSPENPQSTLDMHNVLEEWRTTSGNSRAQPTAVNRIAVNSSVIISGGRLLSTNQYLWRITAKPSASVTLRAFGSSTSRTDIPQTITLDSASRGAWLTTTTSVPPVYILDENTQQETTQFTYVTLMRTQLEGGLVARAHAIYGGSTHDFGSGVGFDANGKSVGGLQYMTDAGIESSGHHSGNVNWYYKNNYRLNEDGNLIPVTIEYAPGFAQVLCDGDRCYSGQGCYQAPPLHAAEWIEQMSKSGEWGAPLRPEQPFPNSTSYYASANQRNTWFPYVTLEDGVTVRIHQPFDNTKGRDTPMEFMVSGNLDTTTNMYSSFWQRSRSQGGRSDLAYDYRINVDTSDYSSVSTGWSNVVFYTLADGTLKWQTASSTYAGYPILPPNNLAVLKYKQIAVGYGSVIGLKTDGTVVGWGGVDGEVERSTAFFQQQVTFKGRTIKKVAAGAGHYIALLDDGQAVTWGSNESAQCSDPDTVWTPIGLIPIPTATNKEYITNHIPYQDFFYDQKKSSMMYTFDGSNDSQPLFNSCVPAPENRHYRIFRNNLLGCPFHSNNEYTPANPQGAYDTPYVITGETYPIQQGGNFAWSGKINWANQTGAPNDYQFSRDTTQENTGVNSSVGSLGWMRAEENIPMVQASGGTEIGYQNSAANGGTLVYNSVFGTSAKKYVDIAAGRAHSLLLTETGNIETWGQNWYYTITGSGEAPEDPDTGENLGWGRVGQPSGNGKPPAIPHGYGTYRNVRFFKRNNNSVKAIATGYYTSQIIRQSDGSIFAWDRNEWGESRPYLNSEGNEGLPNGPFKQVNGGYHHTCALRENGTVVCWGENTEGECNVPTDLGQCLWIDAGARFTLALKRNGELWAWGKVSVLKAGATDGIAIKLVNDTIIIPNPSIGLLPGHEYPMIVSGAKEIRTASDGLPTKYEPGNMWKYGGFIFAPIRADDGCADALFMSTYTKVLQSSKASEEYAYFSMHLDPDKIPPCITQGDAWKTWSEDDFVNGEYRPKRVFVNYEDQLVDQIRGLDMTARFGPGQYGGMGGVLVNAKIWQKVVSYVKLTRKMNNKIREVWGSQANINHYDMMSFPYYQNWKSEWYPTAGPLMWGELDLLENTADNQSRVSTCPYCGELDIDYPGDAVFNQLSFEEKREFNIKALKAVQNKVFALAAAIAKMCLFEPAEGEPDVLDLRPEMTVLMPQIDPSNFIITGLNHYANSVHGDLVNNAHKYYAATSDGFTVGGETLMNNSETNKSRQMSVHHKEQARVGLFNNQSSGKLYSFMVQGVCGSQVSPHSYEFYNSSDPANAGYKKSFNYPCNPELSTCLRPTFNGIEVSSFPISASVANHQAGDRKYVVPTFPENTNRKSFLRHSVWVNLWNDFLVRSQLGSALKNKDEIIWSDNNLQSVVSSYFPMEVSAPPGYNDQLRPCAQGETPHAGCRDIVANPYILPTPMNDSSRIRNNSFSTFNC
jgi:alpha-tubulin suppressor-like RCC1 family protein